MAVGDGPRRGMKLDDGSSAIDKRYYGRSRKQRVRPAPGGDISGNLLSVRSSFLEVEIRSISFPHTAAVHSAPSPTLHLRPMLHSSWSGLARHPIHTDLLRTYTVLHRRCTHLEGRGVPHTILANSQQKIFKASVGTPRYQVEPNFIFRRWEKRQEPSRQSHKYAAAVHE